MVGGENAKSDEGGAVNAGLNSVLVLPWNGGKDTFGESRNGLDGVG